MQLRSSGDRLERSNQWPKHWKDLLHDEDGSCDMFGRRTQDGRATLKHELAKLAFADGAEWAQDDVSGVELDPKLVKEAREVEMTFSRKKQVFTRVRRAMQRMKGGKAIARPQSGSAAANDGSACGGAGSISVECRLSCRCDERRGSD